MAYAECARNIVLQELGKGLSNLQVKLAIGSCGS